MASQRPAPEVTQAPSETRQLVRKLGYSYDRTSIDTGETDISFNLELENMIDSMSELSSSSDDAAIFD